MKHVNSIAARAGVALLVAAGFGFSGIAAAGNTESVAPSKVVRYGDLNLATEAGAKTLYRRIVAVAKQVCPDADSRDLMASNVARSCQRDTVQRAVNAVHNPHLAAIHWAATGRG